VEDATFLGLRLASAPGRVMTARPATERLVLTALRFLGGRAARVVDVGTGSGAIAVALAAAAPRAEVWATDTSREAVELARLNVSRHGLEGRVTVREGDLLDPVTGPLDLVVANLPYLPHASLPLHPDLRHEPVEAVYADGDGLDPYRRLLAAATSRLAPGGAVVLQLHREVLAAPRAGLPELRAALDQRTALAA
jgi:HemK-like putative methylase